MAVSYRGNRYWLPLPKQNPWVSERGGNHNQNIASRPLVMRNRFLYPFLALKSARLIGRNYSTHPLWLGRDSKCSAVHLFAYGRFLSRPVSSSSAHRQCAFQKRRKWRTEINQFKQRSLSSLQDRCDSVVQWVCCAWRSGAITVK